MSSPSIIIGLAIVGIALHMLFFYQLRRDCHQEWVRLGSPNPFLLTTPKQVGKLRGTFSLAISSNYK
jgi:heme/copper-type cytochrome/quinol oxidase subunit 4